MINLFDIASSQNIIKNEVDEFLKVSILKTSYEKINSGINMAMYIGFSQIGEQYFINMKMGSSLLGNGTGIFSINKDDALMLRLSNGAVFELLSPKYITTCKGCGSSGFMGSLAHGILVNYPISEKNLFFLKSQRITKIRIYTSERYLEAKVSKSKSRKFSKGINLILAKT